MVPANSTYCTLIASSKMSSQHQSENPTQTLEGFGLCLCGRTIQIWIIKSSTAKSAEWSLNNQKKIPQYALEPRECECSFISYDFFCPFQKGTTLTTI